MDVIWPCGLVGGHFVNAPIEFCCREWMVDLVNRGVPLSECVVQCLFDPSIVLVDFDAANLCIGGLEGVSLAPVG